MTKQETINFIASDELDIDALETRSSDALDFSELPVWVIKDALEAAYEAGLKAAQQS